jgi:Tol biopolymer transport system component
VAYAWDGPSQDRWDIYVKMVGSDSSLRLKGPAQNVSPAWSPDGRFIAFRRFPAKGRTQILLIPPIGGHEKVISEAASAANPTFSRKGICRL